MFKFIGAIFVTSFGVSLGSMLMWPLIVIAWISTVADGLEKVWPWLVAVIVYAVIVAIGVHFLPYIEVQIIAVLFSTMLLGLCLFGIAALPDKGLNWSTVSIALLGMLFCFAGTASVSRSGKFREMGALMGIQLLWFAPLTLLLYNYNQGDYGACIFPLITTLLGVVATFFAAEEVGI